MSSRSELLVVIALAAACGRVHFEPLANDAAGGGDGNSAATYYLVSGDTGFDADLFSVDLQTGQLTLVGIIPAAHGGLGGLASWDANTLYGAGTELVQITLVPFTVAAVGTVLGTWSSLERDGDLLFGIDQDAAVIGRFSPSDPGTVIGTAALPFSMTSGGDLTQVDGVWYWFANQDRQLYTINAASQLTPVGSPDASAPFISGMVHDDAGNIFVHSSFSDLLYPIDKTSGQLGAPITLCVACPTVYDALSGDMTRSPY